MDVNVSEVYALQYNVTYMCYVVNVQNAMLWA